MLLLLLVHNLLEHGLSLFVDLCQQDLVGLVDAHRLLSDWSSYALNLESFLLFEGVGLLCFHKAYGTFFFFDCCSFHFFFLFSEFHLFCVHLWPFIGGANILSWSLGQMLINNYLVSLFLYLNDFITNSFEVYHFIFLFFHRDYLFMFIYICLLVFNLFDQLKHT